MKHYLITLALALPAMHAVAEDSSSEKHLYWGDTHVHTRFSLDAYAFGNRSVSADDAFAFASGKPVLHPLTRHRLRIRRPLDFLVVSDHAEYAGTIQKIFTADPLILEGEHGKRLAEVAKDPSMARTVLYDLVSTLNNMTPYEDLVRPEVRADAWRESIEAADRNNQPGKFTAFIGWEWSSTTDGANLHRVVVTSADAPTSAGFIPFSALDSDNPEDLWNWLDETAERTGADFVAIPHNSNLSKGQMFKIVDVAGNPLTPAYIAQRRRWEPVVEVTQIKGDSETHPTLSQNDEFADFEPYEHALDTREGSDTALTPRRADFVRPALLRGLEIAQAQDANPYQFGLIGSSDMHTGMSLVDEDEMGGKYIADSISTTKQDQGLPGETNGWTYSASGLAAVWAKENTRESLLVAMQRREVYATTGPRIRLEFGAQAGGKRVHMGGELTGGDTSPTFSVNALKDPLEANLDRIQIVKGWVDGNGTTHEKVYDVAWSEGRKVDAGGTLPPVGNTVDLSTGRTANSIGAAHLTASWQDPEFDPDRHAFYYTRVLQIPTARHSVHDALALGLDAEDTQYPLTIQERAYSSPIWFTPAN